MSLNVEEKKILQDLPNSQYGVVLLKFLEEEYTVIGDIMSATEEDLKGRQFAVNFLKKLFSFMKDTNIDKPKRNTYT